MRPVILAIVAAGVLGGCDSGYDPALVHKGITQFQQGDLEKSEATLQRALAAAPQDAATNYYLGRIYHLRGDLYRAMYYYQCCLSLAPQHAAAKVFLAQARAAAGPETAGQMELIPVESLKPED